MARRGAYKSEKRKKEVMRQKKQEMKRQKRTGGKDSQAAPEETPLIAGEVSEETPAASESPEEGNKDTPE